MGIYGHLWGHLCKQKGIYGHLCKTHPYISIERDRGREDIVRLRLTARFKIPAKEDSEMKLQGERDFILNTPCLGTWRRNRGNGINQERLAYVVTQ